VSCLHPEPGPGGTPPVFFKPGNCWIANLELEGVVRARQGRPTANPWCLTAGGGPLTRLAKKM